MKEDVADKTNWRNFHNVSLNPSPDSSISPDCSNGDILVVSTVGSEEASLGTSNSGCDQAAKSEAGIMRPTSNAASRSSVSSPTNNGEGVAPSLPTSRGAAAAAAIEQSAMLSPSRTNAAQKNNADAKTSQQASVFSCSNKQKERGGHSSSKAKRARELHPLDAANMISKLFFGWMFPFIWRGWRAGLTRADIPGVASDAEGCHKIGAKLVAFWDEEIATCKGLSGTTSGDNKAPKREPSLARAVIRAHAKRVLLNSLLTFFSEVVCKSLSAYSVGQMLLHMSRRELVDSPAQGVTYGSSARTNTNTAGWSLFGQEDPLIVWTTILVCSVSAWALTAHFYGFQMMRLGLRVRVGCSYLIYRKSLKLGQQSGASQASTMGKMINLLSNDLDKFNYVCIMVPFLWVGPIQTIVSLCLLWPTLGPACLGSLLVLSILTPIQFYLSAKFASFRRRIAASTDERVRLLNETITSLKLIKLYAWEYPFRSAMFKTRTRETDLINRVSIIKGISVAFMYVSSKLVLFVTIIFHCLLFGGTLDARTLFMSMAMLNNVQFTMTQLMPRVVSLGVESLVSLRRITEFLLSKELELSDRLHLEPVLHKEVLRSNRTKHINSVNKSATICIDGNKLMPIQTDSTNNRPFVDCQNVSARWPGADKQTIAGLSFRCESPELVIICGQLASGKSSLLMSLLNELFINEGRAKVYGSVGYAAQNAWIFAGTLRDNIIFGSGFNELRYKHVLQVCALERDLELLEFGDSTYIQENSLSGGQQARVNLARCLYRERDIYFLDDPFSAVDGRVADHIFEAALKTFLAGKLVLLATHQVRFLRSCDKVLLLDQGKQLAFCKYDELRAKLVDKSGKIFNDQQLERLAFLNITTGSDDLKEFDHVAPNQNENTVGCKQLANKPVADSDHSTHLDATRVSSENVRHDEQNSTSLCVSPASYQIESVEKFQTNDVSRLYRSNNERNFNRNEDTSVGNLFGTRRENDGENEHRSRPIERQREDKTQEALVTMVDRSQIERGSREDETENENEATSGLAEPCHVHAPYGSVSFADKEDKTLITIQGPENGGEVGGAGAEWPVKVLQEIDGHNLERHNLAAANMTNSEDSSNQIGKVADERGGTGEGKEAHQRLEDKQEPQANKVDSRSDGNGGNHGDHGYGTAGGRLPHYRAICIGVQHQESMREKSSSLEEGKHKIVATKLADKHDYDNLRPQMASGNSMVGQNGPAEEEVSTRKLPGLYVWYKYYTQTSVIRLVLIVLTFLITQALFSTVDIYLTVWSLSEQNKALVNEIASSNQHQLSGSINYGWHKRNVSSTQTDGVIQYDLSLVTTAPIRQMEVSVASLSSYIPQSPLVTTSAELLTTGHYFTSGRPLIEMVQEIHKASNSPLSLQSSQLPFVAPMDNFFVPVVDLFYMVDPGMSDKLATFAGRSAETIGNASHQLLGKLQLRSSFPLQLMQQRQQKHQNQITGGNFPARTALLASPNSVMLDENISEESEAAINVKSIYRPLYLFVNNFTSGHHALTYATLLMALFSFSAITNVLSLTSSNKSAISLYKKLTDSALFAKLAFFDQNPVGRFLNRATRDIGIIDEAIPYNANQAYDALLQTAATFVVVAAVDITLAMPSLIILFIFLIYHSIHVKPTKDIQRLEGASRSPIISHISTTLAGLHTIRATKSEHRFEQLFIKHQDAHTSVFLLYLGCNRSMAVVLDSLNATYTGIIAFWAVVSGLAGPSAGLIITSAMLLSGLTQHGVMKLTETESLMTSVERVIEYCSLPQEENYDRRGDRAVNSSNSTGAIVRNRVGERCSSLWPNNGSVEYRQVDLYYNKLGNCNSKPVLKNISFKLNPGEKVGIIGRTGAGKSSIITTLFRLYDFEGTILVDGVDIKEIDLIELRSAIGIIPQNPILFSTSIRENLDPLNVYDDFSLWAALDKAHLRDTVSALPGKLDYNIGSGGCGSSSDSGVGIGFSAGQKQLICLARVLLRRSSLIVMDEATANVDPTTDAIIQTTIRREFKHCTVITIAHRLETILDCDRIMVLEAGRIVDFDSPEQLAAKKDGYFASLLQKSDANQEQL